jgi:predicted RNA polymerase sigma factor
VAVAMIEGPAPALALVDELAADRRMAANHRVAAVRGHLFEMAGDRAAAVAAYETAARQTTSLPERDYLQRRAAAIESLS